MGGAEAGWSSAPAQPEQLPRYLPSCPAPQPGQVRGQRTSHSTGGERQHQRAALSPKCRCCWAPRWAARQTFTCSTETPGQGLQRAVKERSRARAERQGRGVTAGDRQCPPACLDWLIFGAHPGHSPALNSGASRSQPAPAADPIPLMPHIWQQLLCQPVGGGGWRAGVRGHLQVQLPHGRAVSLHLTLHVWLMGSGI